MNDPFAPIGDGKPNGQTPPPASREPEWSPVIGEPSGAPAMPTVHSKLGAPSKIYCYPSARELLLMQVWRFERPDGKEIRPLALYRSAGGVFLWRWESLPPPRPLYGLDRLAARALAPVVVCEGEKAADAAGRLLPDFVCITSSGGSKAAAKSDWSPLRGRDVTIWPDADAPGFEYARKVAELCHAAGAASVAIITPPGGPLR
jgi:putative DNA primase/helicase